MGGLLVLVIFLPLVGAAMIWSLAEIGPQYARKTALATVLATFLLSGFLISRFRPDDSGSAARGQIGATLNWLSADAAGVNVQFSVGLDGLTLWLFGLTALLMITAVLVSWEAVQDQASAFYALLLLLETGMLGVFAARDIILFYVFFEATLIPLFFLIGIWGGQERRHAAIKFFLYTLAGSVLTFLGLLAIVLWNYHSGAGVLTFSIPELTQQLALHPIPAGIQLWIFLALFAGFAIKVPLFPLHTWLPLAHVEAPTAGSILLAGVLLKIGTYGFLRFSVPMLPLATAALMPWVLGLSVIGVLYGALVALAQSDIKRLVAYSSVSHLGYCMLGLFALNPQGVQGGTLQMISHGLSTGGLFAVIGMLYERYHTRQIDQFGGLAAKLPRLAVFMLILTFASIGLPGMCGFAGEFLLLLGLFQRGWGGRGMETENIVQVISVLAVLGIVLGAWYMLALVRRTFFGPLREPHHAPDAPAVCDLSLREVSALAPLVVFIFWIGLAPSFFLDRMAPTVDRLAYPAQQALLPPVRFPPAPVPAVRQASGSLESTGTGEVARVD